MSPGTRKLWRPYTLHDWRIASLLFVGYVLTAVGFSFLIPSSALLYPATAIGLAGLFFGGLRLWPVVLAASIVASLLMGMPAVPLVYRATVELLQALSGAFLLRGMRIDPLFRSSRDMFTLLATVAFVSLIRPTLLGVLMVFYYGRAYTPGDWGYAYAATLFLLLVLTPFLLRWFAKPRFNRPFPEILESVAAFATLSGVSYLLFIGSIGPVLSISATYLLFIPLFWIALRLRPRFVTLAMVVVSVFATTGTVFAPGGDLIASLFETETFLIALTAAFLLIVSLEEDRRLSGNLMRSQLFTLENAVARISNESKAKNDFIAILAHELRNPLAPVVSAIDLLKLKSTDAEDQETLSMMENRMRTVRRLLDDLLDVSRISEGKIVLKRERVNLETIVKRAIISTEHYLKERHQELEVKGLEPLHVTGDAVRLEQIVSNLLTNASKYSNSGDRITLSLRRAGSHAEICVSDEGIGIEKDALERIFTPFHQVGSDARTQKGLGIGLALVENFVELHGGSVRAESEGKGKGSRFIVLIPLAQEAGWAQDETITADPSSDIPSILILDRNDVDAWSMGRLLEMRGCAVEYAYDATEAVETVSESSFTSVLIDVDLPHRDGYRVARTLRDRGFSGTLVALSKHAPEQVRASAKKAGFNSALQKPARLAELTRVLPELA